MLASRTLILSRYLPLVSVVLLAFAAHFGAFTASYYMDDFPHILLNPEVQSGAAWPDAWKERALTYLVWRGLYLAFGHDPVPYHALNVVLHAVNAALALAVMRRVCLAGPEPPRRFGRSISWIAAAVFACHPLASEAVSYASQASILLVTAFSLGAAFAMLAWGKTCPGRAALVTGLCVLLAAQSKEAGFWLSLICVSFIGAMIAPPGRFAWWHDQRLRLWSFMGAGGLAMIFSAAWIGPLLATLSRPNLWWQHVLTQARVLGEYVRRIVLPRDLCSDHRIMWSTSAADTDALLKLIVIGLVTLAILFLGFGKRRWLALVFGLAFFPLLLRFAYIVDEPMVEYRVYPALPWIGLLFAFAICRITREPVGWRQPAAFGNCVSTRNSVGGPRLQTAAALTLVLSFGVVTWQRERVWQTEGGLVCDVLRQYPLNLRALGLHFKQVMTDGYPDVALMAKDLPDLIVREALHQNDADPARDYSVSRLRMDYASCQYFLIRAELLVGQTEDAAKRADALLVHLLRDHRAGDADGRFVAFLSCATVHAVLRNEETVRRTLDLAQAVLPEGGRLAAALEDDLRLALEARRLYLSQRHHEHLETE